MTTAEVPVDAGAEPPTPPTGNDDVAAAGTARSWSWHIMQLSSWILLVLLPLHVLGTWVFHDPGHFGVAFYVDRWHDGAWRLLDGLLVVLAFVHGGIGLNGVLTGRVRGSAASAAITIAIAVVLAVVGLLAVSTIGGFDLS